MRRAVLTCLCALALGLGYPSGSSAAVTIGSGLSHGASAFNLDCNAGHQCTLIQPALNPSFRAPGGLTAPSSGVIVRFRVLSANSAPPVRFRVVQFLAPNGIGKGTSDPLSLVPGLNALPARMPITVGDSIAINCCQFSDNHQIAFTTAEATDKIEIWGTTSAGPLPDGGSGTPVDGPTFSTRELLINADIEPDADKDGFGDETQDCAPADPALNTACPPPAGPPPAGRRCKEGFRLKRVKTKSGKKKKCVRKKHRR